MTQDEIIEMAREAGFILSNDGRSAPQVLRMMTKFTKLVAAKATDEANARANSSWTLMCKKMVEAEREACLQIQEDWQYTYANDLVQKIRARAQADGGEE